MDAFESISRVVNSRSIRFKFKYYIVFVSIAFSVAVYRYVVDYFDQERDFVAVLREYLSANGSTYEFWAHSNPSEVSVYSKIAIGVEEELGTKVKLRGVKGNALENAFGVRNRTKAFGIIQSDTYLSADFVKNPDQIQQIARLYMERIHILYVHKPGEDPPSFESISSNNPESVELIELVLNRGALLAGKSSSGGQIILPRFLKIWGVENEYKLKRGSDDGFKGIVRSVLDSASTLPYPRIAFLVLGADDDLISRVASQDNAMFLGISSSDIHELNSIGGVDLEVTTLGEAYGDYRHVPTGGVYATLVGSPDLSSNEVYEFLSVLAKLKSNDVFGSVFSNPSISLADIRDSYAKDGESKFNLFVRSLVLFVVSVVSATFLFSHLLLYFTSVVKQNKFYNAIMSVYKDLTELNLNSIEYSNTPIYYRNYTIALKIKEGMRNFERIGKAVRHDYNSGGMTIKHHEYLLSNLNHVFSWFEQKLTSRLMHVVEFVPSKVAKELDIRSTIISWHSEGFLAHESYKTLIDMLNDKEVNRALLY